MTRLRLALVALLLSAGARAEDEKPIHVSGYLKDVWLYSASAIDGRPYYSNTARARLSLDARYSVLRAQVDYDHEVIAGTFFRTKDYAFSGLGEPSVWLDADQTISTGTTNLWRHRLYRGWLGLETEKAALRLGRQRIAWGTGKIWNPTDVLNPYQPTSVERDQRRGVDAAYARLGIGELSQAELIYAPRDRWVESTALARGHGNVYDWDVSLVAGKVGLSTHSYLAGGDFAGNLFDGTLHGEWSYTRAEVRAAYWKVDIGYDYTFATNAPPGIRDAQVVVEYLYNGWGSADPRRYQLGDVLAGREVALARHYTGVTVAKDLSPLWKLEIVWLENCTDGSSFANPSIQFNALENLYLTAGLQRFGGPRRTEFGRVPNIVNLQAQYFF